MPRAGTALSLTTLLALLAGCQVTLDYAAEEQAIRDLDAEWVAAVAAGDAAKIATFYGPEAYYLPPGGPPVIGPEAIEQAWAEGFEAMPGDLTFGPEKIVFAALGDMAWEYGTWQFAAEGMEDHGKYVVVWQKIEGAWKAVVDIYNSNTPPAM
ncbi:MAG: DUF4440 domain-containing protein [Gemmatimonadota bacterium]|nr:MAG: DUF4440 domain-containing protein [Gemmatimonadota bacterium]